MDVIYGRHPVREALKSGRVIDRLYVTAGGHSLVDILQLAAERGIKVEESTADQLTRMCGGGKHQGVAAMAGRIGYTAVNDILDKAKSQGNLPLICILDHLEDPHNLGAILRVVDAVGAHGVIIPERRSAGLTPGVGRSSVGAWEYVPVARVVNIVKTIKDMKKDGLWVVGADMAAPVPYYDVDYTIPVALVIGNEGKGLARLVRENCDLTVRLPMKGKVRSLNASTAAAVLLYEVLRQRSRKN